MKKITPLNWDPARVHSFGRYDIGTSHICKPQTIQDVVDVFTIARNSGGKIRVAIRGGGHSFDGQALHKDDTGTEIILSTEAFQPQQIEFHRDADTVTLGSGVSWGNYVNYAILEARKTNSPIRIPGSMQTGGKATVGGTLAGDCLSRFSGIGGKESFWIDSFRILTPERNAPVSVSAASNPDLFYSVIGGHGYIGFVTDATYKLISIDNTSCAHTRTTTHQSLGELIQKQIDLIGGATDLRGISSAWFTDSPLAVQARRSLLDPTAIKGVVFNSSYAKPAKPALPNFPLYHDLNSEERYNTEVAARNPFLNWTIHEGLWVLLQLVHAYDDDLAEFIFFMDGDAAAREKFYRLHKRPFPIVQQTFVVPTAATELFTEASMIKIHESGIDVTEYDMLYVKADECLMSANYHLDGFAVTFTFEPVDSDSTPPPDLCALLRALSVDCLNVGGRIHLPKNSHVDRTTFRAMFGDQMQIQRFEAIKAQYDPKGLLQNPFSDKFFLFPKAT